MPLSATHNAVISRAVSQIVNCAALDASRLITLLCGVNELKMSTYCQICGIKKGLGFNHEKCSKELQKLTAGSGENKKPRKRMQKNGETAANYFNKYYT